MSLSERLKKTVRTGLAVTALAVGGQEGYAENHSEPIPEPVAVEQRVQNRDYSSLIQAENDQDRALLKQYIDAIAETKDGSELFDFMQKRNTKISFSPPTHDTALASFSPENNSIQIRRLLQNDPLALLWALSHESEHSRHTYLAEQKGYDHQATLDDRYTFLTIKEGLAERNACAVTLEYLDKHPEARSLLAYQKPEGNSPQEDKLLKRIEMFHNMIQDLYAQRQSGSEINDIAAGVFDRRMSLKDTPDWDLSWQRYEKNAPGKYHREVSPKGEDDWNQIVSDISEGRVCQIKDLPMVSCEFVKKCISSELDRMPDAKSLNELDISCAHRNKKHIIPDEIGIRDTIISTMFDIQRIDAENGKTIPPELLQKINGYLGVELSQNLREEMGWLAGMDTDSEYRAKANIAQSHLRQKSTKESLDGALALLNSPEAKTYLAGQVNPNEDIKNIKLLGLLREFFYPEQNNVMTLARNQASVIR